MIIKTLANPHNKHKGNKRMKDIFDCVKSIAIIIVCILSMAYMDRWDHKNNLEIEKLKYELVIYKENAESVE